MHAAEFDQKGAGNPPAWWPGSRSESLRKRVRIGAVLSLSLFITLGPAMGQLLGHHSVFFREWIMFAGAGIGVVKGSFTLHRADGVLVRMTPLEVLGPRHTPGEPPYDFGKRVFEDRDLRSFADRVCGPTGIVQLSFQGWVGTRRGWRAMDVADVCALPPPSTPADDAAQENAV